MCNSTETASRPDAASNVCAKCAATARNVNTHCVQCNARFHELDQLYCHKCGRNQKPAEGTQNHTTYGNSSEVTQSSKIAVPGTRTSQPSALSLTHEEKRGASPGEGNENSLAISHCFDYKLPCTILHKAASSIPTLDQGWKVRSTEENSHESDDQDEEYLSATEELHDQSSENEKTEPKEQKSNNSNQVSSLNTEEQDQEQVQAAQLQEAIDHPPVMGEDGYNENNTSDPVQPTSSDGSLQVCTLCSMHEFTTWW